MSCESIPYRLIRSNRKSVAIQITPDGQVTVRCPLGMKHEVIQKFVMNKADWIRNHLPPQDAPVLQPFTSEEIHSMADAALKVIPQRVAHFAPLVGVDYGRVTIRNQRSKWGSCSSKGNLNFNCLLMLAPPEVLDYVVVHELCHRKEMNHSERFWREVENILPDYRERKKWLKENGGRLIARMQVHETI